MALTSPIKEFYLKPLPGMNTKQEDLENEGKYVELVQNGRFEDEPGAVIKRDPTSKYNLITMGAGKPVMGIKRFYTTDGSVKSVTVCDQSILVGTDATGVMTALTLPAGAVAGTPMVLTENKRMAFAVYQDLLIMGNASDNLMVYDGSEDNVIWELGSCKAVVGAAGAVTLTDVSYQVTMGDATGDDMYICGALSNEIEAVTSEKIELTNIPIGPASVTNRKLYRRDSLTGGTYKYLATIADNSTTTYSDNTADISLEADIDSVTDDMPKGNMLRVYRERLFVGGDLDNINRVYYSNPYAPWFIQQTTNLDYMEIDKDDGDRIMGIPIVMGTMCICKRNNIRKAHIALSSGSWDASGGFNLTSGGPESWYVDDPIAFTGPIAQWSVLQTQVGILFLGWNHWYQFDGANVTPIIDEFDTAEILPSRYTDSVAHFSEGTLFWAYTDKASGATYHDVVGRYNFFRKALSLDRFTRYDSDTGITKKTGVNCFTSYDGGDEAGDVYYGDSRDGFIYRAEDTPQWLRWNKKSQLLDSTVTNVIVGGVEDNAWFEVGWGLTIDELLSTNLTPTGTETAWSGTTQYHKGDTVLESGTKYVCDAMSLNNQPPNASYWTVTADAVSIDNLPGSCDRGGTDGTIEFDSMEINSGALIDLYWNLRKYNTEDTAIFSIRTGLTQLLCEAAAYTELDSNSPASMADVAGNVWFQLKCVLSCESVLGSPRVYYADGYIMKASYKVGGASIAEHAVEFIYDTGWRHFDQSFVDKIWKKLVVWHEGDSGTYRIDWWTENSSGQLGIVQADGSRVVDLTLFPARWESFFPSTAMGRKLRLRIYKNDIEDFKLKEFRGLYTPEPVLI